MNLETLDHADFKVEEFFAHNYVTVDKDTQKKCLDYDKLRGSVQVIQQFQKKTCEKIVSLVDENLPEYIDISTKFEKMKEPLNQTDVLFRGFSEPFGEFVKEVGDKQRG